MSDPLIDPLRVHTYGVKRPLEEKKEEIEELYKDGKRYYPKDQRGGLDEWGAVIKNQNEMFTRLADMQKLDKRKQMANYSNELVNESDKRVREKKYNEDQLKQYELNQARLKQQENDMLNQQSLANKKSLQSMLASDYEQAMRLKKMQKEEEKRMNLMTGQASVNKAQIEMNYLQKAEMDKKKMIREILTSEK